MANINPELPINKTASLVVNTISKENSQFPYECDRLTSMVQFPTQLVKNKKNDLTGKTFGKFEVIGLSIWENSKGDHRWVCRCKCGRYQIFRKRTILSGNLDIACIECEKLMRLREREFWNKTGINILTKRRYK